MVRMHRLAKVKVGERAMGGARERPLADMQQNSIRVRLGQATCILCYYFFYHYSSGFSMRHHLYGWPLEENIGAESYRDVMSQKHRGTGSSRTPLDRPLVRNGAPLVEGARVQKN